MVCHQVLFLRYGVCAVQSLAVCRRLGSPVNCASSVQRWALWRFPAGCKVVGRVASVVSRSSAEGAVLDPSSACSVSITISQHPQVMARIHLTEMMDNLSTACSFPWKRLRLKHGQLVQLKILGPCPRVNKQMGVFLDGSLRLSQLASTCCDPEAKQMDTPTAPSHAKNNATKTDRSIENAQGAAAATQPKNSIANFDNASKDPTGRCSVCSLFSASDLRVGKLYSGWVLNSGRAGVFVAVSSVVTVRLKLGELLDHAVSAEQAQAMYPVGKMVRQFVLVSMEEKGGQVQLEGSVRNCELWRYVCRLRSSNVDQNTENAKDDDSRLMAPISFDELKVGNVVIGAIKSKTDFGVFIRLEHSENLVGLCHKSQIADGPEESAARMNLLKPGDRVKGLVIKKDQEKKRLSLSIDPKHFNSQNEDSGDEVDAQDEQAEVILQSESEDSDTPENATTASDAETDKKKPVKNKKLAKARVTTKAKCAVSTAADSEGQDQPSECDDSDEAGSSSASRRPVPVAALIEKPVSKTFAKKRKITDIDGPVISHSPAGCLPAGSDDPPATICLAAPPSALPAMDAFWAWGDDLAPATARPTAALLALQTANEDEDENEVAFEAGNDGVSKNKHSQGSLSADEDDKTRKLKERQKREAEIDAQEQRLMTGEWKENPESVDDFERLILIHGNAAVVWIKYMAHFLKLGTLDKARAVAERAVKHISYREDQERFNVWIAYLNMECAFGDKAEELFERAIRFTDSKKLMLQMISVYERNGKLAEAKALCEKCLEKFPYSQKVRLRQLTFMYTSGKDPEGAPQQLLQALRRIPQRKHIGLVASTARLEYKYGSIERYDRRDLTTK
eukprot:GHVT01006020.1.p1 GENE.GHVT01006020.1~~GHVT01006020.1.p1  ORF type:complete len:849 (+),score=138.02 GHVT01006020.1:360-2906(+)